MSTPEHDPYRFDFPLLWPKALIGSAVLVLVSVIALAVGGLNLGIDFTGGTSAEVITEASIDEVADALPESVRADARIQEAVDIDDVRSVRIRSSVEDESTVDEARVALAQLGEVTEFESVGPTWGDEITEKALRALIFFFIAVAFYISVRLEWRMALGALAAVAHDIVISVGVYAVFRFEVTPATLIAFLTIMGYSLYDTIVVYDKVRDITARVGTTGRYTYTEMMNLSLNRVLARSINTTITSVLPVLSMLLIGSFLLGAGTLREFSIALLVGLLVGGYSSLFVASSVVSKLKEQQPEYAEIAEKVAKRSGDVTGTRKIEQSDALVGAAPVKPRTAPSSAKQTPRKSRASTSTAVPPRPRKTKRRR